ncbi:sensor histidine kinase [Allostreptomyces psammosilenae]|uniref:histidine kinase n=1 Tax=Allostreptomyces psammosilenae TaxID=1892865 RepID=A0A852ZWH7_9ACTN|nr:histidine kinase [Allostreptomyces psammosilenae]NYI06753.1 signal transduction histidine kinase [Allostreptomyces psammosilenae]
MRTRTAAAGPRALLARHWSRLRVPAGRVDGRTVAGHAALCAVVAAPLFLRVVETDATDAFVSSAPGRVVGGLVTVAVVALGRTHPLVSLLAAGAAAAADWRFALLMVASGYLAGRRTPDGRQGTVALAVLAAAALLSCLVTGAEVYRYLVMATGLLLLGVFPWLIGRYRRQQVQLVWAGWERAEQLEREQRIVSEQARLRERARIAQDMHDSLGHDLSLVALRAGALEVAPDLDERHRRAAAELRSGVADAAERLRDIIGVLRDDADPSPSPTGPVGEGIEELVERARRSGVAVRLRVEPGSTASDATTTDAAAKDAAGPDAAGGGPGAEPGYARDLPPAVRRAAYRVVQESLTNATKHAPGAEVTVRLTRTPGELLVTVANTAPAPGAPAPELARGHRGLAGLRERVRLVGGTLRAGPADGGFRVEARIPLGPAGTAGAVAAEADAPDGAGDGPEPWARRSESAAQLEQGRRRLRRGLVTAILVPGGLLLALGAAMAGLYAYDSYNSRLTPAAFEALAVGQPQREVEEVLPAWEAPERRDGRQPPIPEGARCRYYRSDAGFLPAPFDVYRLCFRQGALVAKDVIPPP